jgi:hypothetical protein
MSYFKTTGIACNHHQVEWLHTLRGIKSWAVSSTIPKDISDPLEAKALFVFTISRRLLRTAKSLENNPQKWKPVFLEATILLFPMIELVGHCRVDTNQVKTAYGSTDVGAVNIWSGLYWLLDAHKVPTVMDNKQREDTTLLDKWQIGHLVSLRHYLLHGTKQVRYGGKLISTEDIISFQFPEFVIERSIRNLPIYWKHLCHDDGSVGWIDRLASADVRPLIVQGSHLFKTGLIDPDIVECLEGAKTFL